MLCEQTFEFSDQIDYRMAETLKKVGNYRLLKKIGSGAFSEVFQARKEGELEKYAIKMVKIKSLSKEIKEMITKEVLLIKSINHPNIVKLYDTLETTNNYYLVFEFCEKGDLDKYLKQYYGPIIPTETIQKIMYCIADALALVHSKGIAHRDIKLANILLKKDFTIKLADFGFAKEGNSEDHMMKTYAGTPITMAPQILEGKPYDKKCDIWSLGIILYQLCFAKLPFPVNEGFPAFVDKVLNQPIIIPDENKHPPEFIELLRRSLEKQQANRYSIEEFLNNKWIQQGKTTSQEISMNPSEVKAVTVNDILRNKQQSKEKSTNFNLEFTADKEIEENLDNFQICLADRIDFILTQEVSKIINRHLEIREQLKKLVKEDFELKDLLEYYDQALLSTIQKKQIKIQAQGFKEAYVKVLDLKLKFPEALSEKPKEKLAAGTVLFTYLKKLSIQDIPIEQRKERYEMVIKFLEFINNFDLQLTVIFSLEANHADAGLELQNIVNLIKNSEKKVEHQIDQRMNFLSIALECREKNEKLKECKEVLRNNCLKRIDEIQKQINGY